MAATLLIFESERSGQCRRLRGYLAQVLQRNSNQDTFRIVTVDVEARPDLAARFRATTVPTLMIVEGNKVRRRLAGPSRPPELREFLEPWLKPSRQARSEARLAHV